MPPLATLSRPTSCRETCEFQNHDDPVSIPRQAADPLLGRLRAGDENAYRELVNAYHARMTAVALRVLRSHADAEDVVQQAFLSAFASIKRFECRSSLGTWLHRIVVNACLMHRRRHARRPMVSLSEISTQGGAGDFENRWNAKPTEEGTDAAAREEMRTLVRHCLTQLPAHFRTIIQLRDLEGFDTETTADLLNVSIAVVKTRLHRARMALKEILSSRMQSA